MKRSILTTLAIIGLAIPAVASASTISDSFQRDLDRSHSQVSTETRYTQDSFQQHVNRVLNGSETLFASFDRDLYRAATPATEYSRTTDSVQQWINVALSGNRNNNPLIASFERDLNRTAPTVVAATRSADSVQQLINIALTGNNSLIASYDAFWWKGELTTAFA